MKLSTIVFLVFAGLGMLGYLYYGWLICQTVASEANSYPKTFFAATFIFWLLTLAGLLLFALKIWREKDREEDKARI